MTNQFKMKEGSPGMSQEPCIEVVGKGHRAYLWIGNDAEYGAGRLCFATLSGKSTLTKLIKALQEAMK